MGTLTLAEMRTELHLLLNSRDEVDPDETAGATRLDSFLNWSYLKCQMPATFEHVERQVSDTITLVTDDSDYAMPSTIWAIDHIRYGAREKNLTPISRAQLSNITIPDGPPSRFARWGTTLYLDTTPTSTENGQTLTVYGWREPSTLATSSAASALHSVWDEVIVTGAAWRGWRSLGDHVRADIFREEWAALANDLRSVLSQEGHIPGWRVEVGHRIEYGRGTR